MTAANPIEVFETFPTIAAKISYRQKRFGTDGISDVSDPLDPDNPAYSTSYFIDLAVANGLPCYPDVDNPDPYPWTDSSKNQLEWYDAMLKQEDVDREWIEAINPSDTCREILAYLITIAHDLDLIVPGGEVIDPSTPNVPPIYTTTYYIEASLYSIAQPSNPTDPGRIAWAEAITTQNDLDREWLVAINPTDTLKRKLGMIMSRADEISGHAPGIG